MPEEISTVNVNTVPRRIVFHPPQMRIEFSANWNDTVYFATIKFNGQSLVFNDKVHPAQYAILEAMFKDINGKIEHPLDDAGIEVHTLQLIP